MKIILNELNDKENKPVPCQEFDTNDFFSMEIHTSAGLYRIADNEDGSLTIRTFEGIMFVKPEHTEAVTLIHQPLKKDCQMGHHINEEGRFQSDKYPELDPDKIILSFKDPEAKRALLVLADDYQEKDSGLSEDIRIRLKSLEENSV